MTEILSPKPISQSFSNKEINTAANEEGNNNNNNMMVNPVTRSNGGAPNTKIVSRAAATPNSAQKKKNAAMSLTSLFAGGDSGNISGASNTEEDEEVAAVDVAVPALDTITEMVTLSESNSASFESDNNSIGNNLGVDMDKAANDKRKVEEINNSTEEEEPFSDPMMNYVDPSALVEEQANNNASAGGGGDTSPRKKSRHAYVAPPVPVQQQQQPTPLANVVSTPQKVASILASQLPKTNVPPGVPMPQLPDVQYLPPSSGKTSFEQLMQATTMTSPVPGAARGGQPIYARSLPTQWTATQQAASMPYLNGAIPQQQQPQPQNGSEPPSRKDKSLGVLCKSFMDLYKDAPPNRNDNGAVVEIVEVADHLGVKRRRIYDIINILESIDIVARVKKNTYRWHGTGELPKFFAQLQRDAIDEQTRKMNGTWVENPNKPKVKGMASTCQKLLQIFLTTGKTDFTLAYAADVIMGPAAEAAEEAAKAAAAAASVHNPIPLPDPLAPPALPAVIGGQQMAVATVVPSGAAVTSSNATAQKAMKTKVRRMYDIANVLQALGIIEKYNVGSTSTENKPSLRWVFFLSPEEISQYAQSGGGEATI
ncbi:hypothetical protein ACHAWC_003465 [Mediolabrus comicus]